MRELDLFYLDLPEPQQSCFLALKELIMDFDKAITEEWKYKLPFFYFKGKMFCYLWKDKKTQEPYIGITEGKRIDHPLLEMGDRARIKILRVNPSKDIPVEIIYEILSLARTMYN